MPWRREAELHAPGHSSLEPPNANSGALGSDADISSINDLGDAKQLAQTTDSSRPRSNTRTDELVVHTGGGFSDTVGRPEGVDPELSIEPKTSTAQDGGGSARTIKCENLGRTIRA